MSEPPTADRPAARAVDAVPRPTWRTRAANWVFGSWLPDRILQRRAGNLLERLDLLRHLPPGGVYVDMGSGTGHVAGRLAQATADQGVRLIAIEPVSRPTRRVRQRIGRGDAASVLFARAIGQRLPLADHVVDAVSMFFVLHHIPHALQLDVLAEIKRVLKPGGLLAVWEDTPETQHEYRATERWDRRLNFESKHERHYYRRGDHWAGLLAAHGFEPINRAYFEHHARDPKKGPIRHSGYLMRFLTTGKE